ncbi:unnamed protein product [Mytilus coruscus]|uniref:CCHC-type domain-containing protein n=1 Tax=Mytilus coruscus TaxID=42192 RepID=A0A6J8AZD7_MYTCO|nr:unnamed protein product [Mytilus coruscus]
MLEQSLCETPQESLSTESLNSELENLSVCENSEYRTPLPRTKQTVNRIEMSKNNQMTECFHHFARTGIFHTLKWINKRIGTFNKSCNRLHEDITALLKLLIITNNQGSYIHLHLTMFTFQQVYNMSTTVNKRSTALFTSHLVLSINQQHRQILHTFNNQFFNIVIKMSTNINMAITVHTDWKSTRVNNHPYKIRLMYIVTISYPIFNSNIVVPPTNIQASKRLLATATVTTITLALSTVIYVWYQQQPPPSGEPQLHYNRPSPRPKDYNFNSDYYWKQRRSDPGHKYTGDSDRSDVSAYRQTRNKRRSEPEYNRPREDQKRDFSPIRSVGSTPLHRTRNSPRRFRGSTDSQSESDTDGRLSKSSRGSRKKKDKIEKIQFLSSIPKTLRYNGKEKPGNSPVVLGVGSTNSRMDNRLSRMEEYMEKMMSTVTSLVQEESAKQGTSPSSRSPNQDRSSNYSPRRYYGRGRGRWNHSGDRRYTRRGFYNNECYNCHKEGHYIKDCPDLYVQDTDSRQSVQNNKDDFYDSEGVVSGITTVRSLGAAKFFKVEGDIAGKKVLALVDSGSEVTILNDTIFDTLEPNPYFIRKTTMYGAGTNMTMPCRLTSPIKFKIGHMQFRQQLYVALVSCDMILGCDLIIQNKCVMNIGELLITVQNMNMPIMLGDDNTAHEPIVNIVHGSDSSSDEKPSTEGSTQRFTATQLSRQSADFHYETVIPQESSLGMMASASTQEYDERGIQEEPDQCRDNKDQCCTNKVESRENLGFYTCPKSGKREKTCVQSRTGRKCPVKNCPVVVDRRDVKRHCFEEHLSEIFQTYHSKRLMNDRGFHQHRAYVVMLIGKWLTRQETVTAKDLVNFLNEKSFVPRSTHVTGLQMQIHRTVCKEMGWTDYFRYSLRPVNSSACLLNWRVLTSVLHFLTPEQQDLVAEGFNYNPRNPPEPEELAQMNASFWPVFVNKTQDESAILQKEGEEDNVLSEQKERTIVMDEKEEIHYESENLNVFSTSLVENKSKKRKLQSSIADNDTDAHHASENETAILLGHQVSQIADSQVEPSFSQL